MHLERTRLVIFSVIVNLDVLKENKDLDMPCIYIIKKSKNSF